MKRLICLAAAPNALVFGTGAVPQRAMVRTGFYGTVLAAAVLPLLVSAFMSLITVGA